MGTDIAIGWVERCPLGGNAVVIDATAQVTTLESKSVEAGEDDLTDAF